jgi:hypothetical protein
MRASSGRARIFWCSEIWFFFGCLLFLACLFRCFFFTARLRLKRSIVGALMVFGVSVFGTVYVTTVFALKRKGEFLSAYFTVRHRNHVSTISCFKQLFFMNYKFSSHFHVAQSFFSIHYTTRLLNLISYKNFFEKAYNVIERDNGVKG